MGCRLAMYESGASGIAILQEAQGFYNRRFFRRWVSSCVWHSSCGVDFMMYSR